MSASEREHDLEIDAAVGGLGATARATSEESANRVRLTEQGREDVSNPRPEVHVVEEISGVSAEREVEAPVVIVSPAKDPARATSTSAEPSRAKTAPDATATTTSTTATASSARAAKAAPN